MAEAFHTILPVYDSADEYRPEPPPEPEPLPWCDGSIRIGIHTSIAGDIANALELAHKLGCNALQIFSASPRMWPRGATRIDEATAQQFRVRRTKLGLGPLVVHANYLINLASADPVMRTRSIQAFHDELIRASALGADFLVVHPGAGLGSDRTQALRAAADGLRQAARGTRLANAPFSELHRGGLRILIENTSGMGTAIGVRFEELRAILDAVPDLSAGVCLDTAHAFAAGYDLRSEAGLEQVIAELDRVVGLDHVPIIHVNDLKTAFGSRVDRHAHIGKGTLGDQAVRRIVNHPRLSAAMGSGLPGRGFILETPIDAPGDDRRNVRVLWRLAGVSKKVAGKVQDGFTTPRSSRRSPEGRGKAKASRQSSSVSSGKRQTKKPRKKARG